MFVDSTIDFSSSSNSVTMDSTENVRAGMSIVGANMPADNFITVVNSSTAFTIKNQTTGTASDITVVFSKPEIDERYQRILIYYPSWRVSERLRDLNLISYFKNEWLEQKQRVILERQSRDGSTILTVPYNDF